MKTLIIAILLLAAGLVSANDGTANPNVYVSSVTYDQPSHTVTVNCTGTNDPETDNDLWSYYGILEIRVDWDNDGTWDYRRYIAYDGISAYKVYEQYNDGTAATQPANQQIQILTMDVLRLPKIISAGRGRGLGVYIRVTAYDDDADWGYSQHSASTLVVVRSDVYNGLFKRRVPRKG